eukprot:1168034-Rhodomonas_salina.2
MPETPYAEIDLFPGSHAQGYVNAGVFCVTATSNNTSAFLAASASPFQQTADTLVQLMGSH